jgi:hypothetical protein
MTPDVALGHNGEGRVKPPREFTAAGMLTGKCLETRHRTRMHVLCDHA